MIPEYGLAEAANMLRAWALEAEDANYHGLVGPLEAMASRVLQLEERTLVMVIKDEYEDGPPEIFYVNPR